MKKIYLFLILFSLSFSKEKSEILIPLDGSNGVILNLEYPENSENCNSVIYKNHMDNYPYDYFPILQDPLISNVIKPDSVHRLEIFGSLQSETGEIMLNQFSGSSGENRDHATNLGIVWKPKNSSLKFFYSQRYVDTYSDGYDIKWREYKKNHNQSMYSDGEGLIHDYLLGYISETKNVISGFSLSSYGYWGATPIFYNPIYKEGYLFSPVLIFSLPNSKLSMVGDIDINSEYQNHQDKVNYNDAKCDLSWFKPFGKGASFRVLYQRDTKMESVWKFGGELSDTLEGIYSLNLNANLYGSLKPEAFINFDLTVIPKITLSIEAGAEYHSRIRGYNFLNGIDTVNYSSYDYFEPQFHVSASYNDTLLFPANLKIWYDYSSKRSWESIRKLDDNKMEIMRDTISQFPVEGLLGLKGNYLIIYKFLKADLWGGLVITPKNKHMQYSLPYELGIDIEFGKRDSTGLFAGLYFSTREQLLFKYYDITDSTVQERLTPARTSLSLKARVPVKLPVLRKKLKTAVEIGAGPIRFAKEQRLKEHPLGNDYGPSIMVAFRAAFN